MGHGQTAAAVYVWIAEDLDFPGDRFDELKEPEKRCITMILAFFAASDGIVMENLINRFIGEIKMPEARFFYTLQSYNEAIHSETYSLLIESYVNATLKNRSYLRLSKPYPPSVKRENGL